MSIVIIFMSIVIKTAKNGNKFSVFYVFSITFPYTPIKIYDRFCLEKGCRDSDLCKKFKNILQ